MRADNNPRIRGYDSYDERHRQRRHEGHHRRHHHRRHRGDQPPYLEQREGSSGSSELHHHRPSSVASVGAWIKAKSADWFNPTDPFGAMSMYLHTMRNLKEGRTHGPHGQHRHRHHRRRHRHHYREDDAYPESANRGGRHYNVDVTDSNRYNESDQPTYPSYHRSRRSSSYADGVRVEDIEMGSSNDKQMSPVMMNTEELARRRKRSRSKWGNELQRRDRVVIVCFIALNCLLTAIGLGSAVLSGLAIWSPQTYQPLYKGEVTRIFEDILKMKSQCGKQYNNFYLKPNEVLPGVFPAIFGASVALCAVAIYALIIPVVSSRWPKQHKFHVALHALYMLAILAFTGLIAAYLCIYFQNVDDIEAKLRLNAKTQYIAKYRGNPMQSCDSISNFVNFIQRYFRCCGVDDGHDFEDEISAPMFHGSIVDDGKQYNSDSEKPKYRVPLTCCRLGKYYDPVNNTDIDTGTPGKGRTTPNPFRGRKFKGYIIDLCRRTDSSLYGFTDRTSYMRNGCWPVVKDFFSGPARIGLITLGVFCLILLFAATLSFIQTRLC